MKTKDIWKEIEEKNVKAIAEKMNVKESKVRLTLEQMKQKNTLGCALELIRRQRRTSLKELAERLKISEDKLKKIESDELEYCPLVLIMRYLNELNCLLTFRITDLGQHRKKKAKQKVEK